MGNFVWAIKSAGGTSSDKGSSIIVDPTGTNEVYVVGDYKSTTIIFGMDTLPAPGGNNKHVYLAKFQDTTAVTTAIQNVDFSDRGVLIYPNPASERVFISCHHDLIRIELLDLAANRIGVMDLSSSNALTNLYEWDLSNLPASIYILRITTPTGVLIEKFTKLN
jgi:hypothetical protein